MFFLSLSFSKIWWSKTWCLQSFVKHCPVRVFEKINIVLNALLVALWLVQAELQVLQMHFELFLCLRMKIRTLSFLGICTIKVASMMNSVQSEHLACHRFPLHAQGNTYCVLALSKKPQLIVPPALLCFKLQDFGLKGLFSGNSLVFYLVDLDEWGNFIILIIWQQLRLGV